MRDFISIINDKRSKEDIGPLSWSTAVKFMMARKFDKERAQELYEEHEVKLLRFWCAIFCKYFNICLP